MHPLFYKTIFSHHLCLTSFSLGYGLQSTLDPYHSRCRTISLCPSMMPGGVSSEASDLCRPVRPELWTSRDAAFISFKLRDGADLERVMAEISARLSSPKPTGLWNIAQRSVVIRASPPGLIFISAARHLLFPCKCSSFGG